MFVSNWKACAYSQPIIEAGFRRLRLAATPIGLDIHGPKRDRFVEVYGVLNFDGISEPSKRLTMDARQGRNENHSVSVAGTDYAQHAARLD